MFIYVGKTFTAQLSGERLREVECEKCRTSFFYRLVRTGQGSGSAPYYIGQAGAQQRAARAAAKVLQKRLDKDVEMVACPKCHWVNSDLVEGYRRTRYRPVLGWGCVFAAICLLLMPLIFLITDPRRNPSAAKVVVVAWDIMIVIMIPMAWWLRRQLRLRIDPNVSYPRRPSLPFGTPPALIKQPDPSTGQEILAPAGSGQNDPVAEWLEFRPGELHLPEVCCECLGPAETEFAVPFRINENRDLPVPMCSGCRSRLTKAWWLSAGKWLLVAPAICWGVFLIPGIDEIGHWIMFVLATPTVFVTALLIKSVQSRPYKLKAFDASRAIFGIHLKNPRYHAAVAESLQNKETVLLATPPALPSSPG